MDGTIEVLIDLHERMRLLRRQMDAELLENRILRCDLRRALADNAELLAENEKLRSGQYRVTTSGTVRP